MIRLGGQAVPCGSDDPAAFARAHREFGYSAAYCPPCQLRDKDRIRAIRSAFAAEDVTIAEVGAWGNMIPTDEDARARKLENVCERLTLADEVGALCCVNYLGTPVPDGKIDPHPSLLTREGFDWAVDVVRQILDAVQPTRAKFALEMMQWMPPDSPECYAELIKAVDRPGFAVHLDPVNIIITPRMYFNTGDVIRRCFDLLGEYVVSCHAKDIALDSSLALHLNEVPMGTGNMDYHTYLTELDKLPQTPPLMLEHLKPEQYPAARDHLLKVGRELGLTFA
ncbi:MAG: sugar phosphate isomerase/epimerase [Lentisphaerae bacterium]|jgi:sugar phosphate isomerase/epimerase|nr:sugar phosphate isomerase/epimerase [Lentisphaerota bacterium]MBT4819469.1 sugar phosphate isomerase/epimerase [Lentisphaerota bacterium]MBT5611733.1 sugar phosphate isomerase/epimerase [Lentisphaerota bacterium]MBT7060427.1 sugar phosphate isomerase/epimerase [Lentisphaerota bacterium]MBT7848430.1 sugar phosphate isomerase/epimerase [Lentisphaerota bacterium]